MRENINKRNLIPLFLSRDYFAWKNICARAVELEDSSFFNAEVCYSRCEPKSSYLGPSRRPSQALLLWLFLRVCVGGVLRRRG